MVSQEESVQLIILKVMVLQNGSIKRFVHGCLSKFSDGGKLNWEDDLDLILLDYRSSTQSSTLYSPFELVYGVKGIHSVKTYTYKSLLPKFNTHVHHCSGNSSIRRQVNIKN